MRLYRFCSFSFLILLITACSSKRVVLDPITVKGNALGSNIYRGSYSKITDIVHTKLDLKFDFDSSFVIGKAWITAKPYFYPINQVVLDSRGFQIHQVSLVNKDDLLPLKYSYDGKSLKIDLNKTYSSEQKFTLFIDYTAMPSKAKGIAASGDRGFHFINPTGKENDKPRQFWTQGETESNSAWFPTINGPQEKMTQEISLTVPKQMVTLSNGYLDFSTDNGDGTRTDSWRQEQAHSTYLTMVAGGNFSVIKDKWQDKEVNYYVDPPFAKYAKLVFGKTPEMMTFFSKKLGVEYPWEKYSQIVVHDFTDGAMENTSATVFFEGMNMTDAQYLDENYESIISHELFHHWFGDLVTAESWANLPLNESFATYGEYLWNEHKYGRDYADLYGWKDQQTYLNSDHKDRTLIRFDYADKEQMFDEVSYQKGGRILHMLRKVVGDEAFFKALNIYLKKYSFKTAEVHDLRLIFEEVTGQDLNWFFNQWFLSPGHPVLAIENSYDANTKQVTVNIRQQQDLNKYPLYRLPFAVDIYVDGKAERKAILLERQNQSFVFDVESQPSLVNVDAEKSLLGEKIEKKSVLQYVFQYENAPLFLDRLEAFQALSQKLPQEKQAREVLIKALSDKSWQIRLAAVNAIDQLKDEEKAEVYELVKNIAVSDSRSYVRAAAISVLSKTFTNRDNQETFQKAFSDKAPSVQKALAAAVK